MTQTIPKPVVEYDGPSARELKDLKAALRTWRAEIRAGLEESALQRRTLRELLAAEHMEALAGADIDAAHDAVADASTAVVTIDRALARHATLQDHFDRVNALLGGPQ